MNQSAKQWNLSAELSDIHHESGTLITARSKHTNNTVKVFLYGITPEEITDTGIYANFWGICNALDNNINKTIQEAAPEFPFQVDFRNISSPTQVIQYEDLHPNHRNQSDI